MTNLRTWVMRGWWGFVIPLLWTGAASGQLVSAGAQAESTFSPDVIRVASVASASEHETRQLALLIVGIASYTRWPQATNPLRICVLGRDDLVAYLQSDSLTAGPRTIMAVAAKPSIDFRSQCELVYVTAIPPENARVLLQKTVAAPIVTIGEGVEFCSDGGMFCVDSRGAAAAGNTRLHFSVNLDVISRSGLRINPQVLLLAKTPKTPAP